MARDIRQLRELLADQASLLDHNSKTIAKESLTVPGPRYLDDVFSLTDRTQ